MWAAATRGKYSRTGLRYQSGVTDEEWRVIEPLLSKPRLRGRTRGWPLREIRKAASAVVEIVHKIADQVGFAVLPRCQPATPLTSRIPPTISDQASKLPSVTAL